ncbi:hypothetical protein [Devosia lucknowensis]|uniref:hypothetical protein n=1 Tax=Devosia lucknowensis TaxID=1096929 RepID=UPI0011221639|nr:hypothetical protein [Devosia lucknowensis]
MTPEIYRFIASPIGDWMEIPGTWLEANPGGQVRDQRTGQWFGDVRYRDDMPYLLAGLLPAWSPEVVRATITPAPYFFRRSRDDENPDREAPLMGQRKRKKTSAEKTINSETEETNA